MSVKVIHGHSIEIELGLVLITSGISTSIIPLLELTKDEDEMFDYLKDISEFGHENPHN